MQWTGDNKCRNPKIDLIFTQSTAARRKSALVPVYRAAVDPAPLQIISDQTCYTVWSRSFYSPRSHIDQKIGHSHRLRYETQPQSELNGIYQLHRQGISDQRYKKKKKQIEKSPSGVCVQTVAAHEIHNCNSLSAIRHIFGNGLSHRVVCTRCSLVAPCTWKCPISFDIFVLFATFNKTKASRNGKTESENWMITTNNYHQKANWK